jgi:hypothetical protein
MAVFSAERGPCPPVSVFFELVGVVELDYEVNGRPSLFSLVRDECWRP